MLAACAVVPVLNFLSLGYLINASGQVARTGRLRDGLCGIKKAAQLGSIAVGCWMVTWPLRLVHDLAWDAELISPDSRQSHVWHFGVALLAVVTMLHILWACLRGGRLRHFLWPQPKRLIRWLGGAEALGSPFIATRDYLIGLRLPFYFWLGLRGFAGAALWLFLPVGIMLLASKLPVVAAGLLSFVGGLLLAIVAIHLPFVQGRFAQTGDFRCFMRLRDIRQLFLRAPWAFWLALLITLLFALPLYLLKIELTPRELTWLPSIVFVLFILPARLLVGWALSRAEKREIPRGWFARWSARLAIVPVAAAYSLVVYATPFLSWNGSESLLEQHAFLVPAPLMAL